MFLFIKHVFYFFTLGKINLQEVWQFIYLLFVSHRELHYATPQTKYKIPMTKNYLL